MYETSLEQGVKKKKEKVNSCEINSDVFKYGHECTPVVCHEVVIVRGLSDSKANFLPLFQVAQSSKVWDEVPVPEDLETASVPRLQRYLEDDEDFAADQGSGGVIAQSYQTLINNKGYTDIMN